MDKILEYQLKTLQIVAEEVENALQKDCDSCGNPEANNKDDIGRRLCNECTSHE